MRRTDNAAYPANGIGILFFPSGSPGPAFIATDNYSVIKQYNNSDSYALAVGLLADRLRGQGPMRAAWPREEHLVSRLSRIALQHKLADLGYKISLPLGSSVTNALYSNSGQVQSKRHAGIEIQRSAYYQMQPPIPLILPSYCYTVLAIVNCISN